MSGAVTTQSKVLAPPAAEAYIATGRSHFRLLFLGRIIMGSVYSSSAEESQFPIRKTPYAIQFAAQRKDGAAVHVYVIAARPFESCEQRNGEHKRKSRVVPALQLAAKL
jgi:hypothetical protein